MGIFYIKREVHFHKDISAISPVVFALYFLQMSHVSGCESSDLHSRERTQTGGERSSVRPLLIPREIHLSKQHLSKNESKQSYRLE